MKKTAIIVFALSALLAAAFRSSPARRADRGRTRFISGWRHQGPLPGSRHGRPGPRLGARMDDAGRNLERADTLFLRQGIPGDRPGSAQPWRNHSRTESGNTYQQHAADLHAFLQSLKIEHCYLVGWAAGATTLLEYISSPEVLQPEKVVFVEGGPAAVEMEDYPGLTTPQQARRLLLAFQEDRDKGNGSAHTRPVQSPPAGNLL